MTRLSSEGVEARPTYARPRQARAVRTRARILEAATKELSDRGYAATSTRSIAERASVSVGSFYKYFPSKDALLHELAQTRAADIAERTIEILAAPVQPDLGQEEVRAGARQRMTEVIYVVVDHHRIDPGLHAVLTERRHADPHLDRLTTASEHGLVAAIVALLDSWGFRGDVQATAFILFGMVEGTIHAHVLGGPMVSDERFIQRLVDVMMTVSFPPGAIS